MSIKEYVSLFEIVEWENGVTKLPDNYKCGGAYKFLDYKNIYNKLPITDSKYELLPSINIFKSDINKYSSHKDKFACTWSSETNIDIFQASYISTDKPFILNGFSKLFIIKDKRFLAKWVVYFINGSKSIQKNRLSIAYTTRCNMSISELKRIKIPLINIEEQQTIIDIIEPFERLYDECSEKLKLLYFIAKKSLKNFNSYNETLNFFKNFMGFAFSQNDFIENGKWDIYKIANIGNENIKSSKTNNFKKDVLLKEKDIVVGLSGTLGIPGIIFDSNKYLLNQRLLCIRSQIPLFIKIIILDNYKLIKSFETGSVQGNITKNDILNLKIDKNIINENNILLSNLYINLEKIKKLCNKIIHLLIQLKIM